MENKNVAVVILVLAILVFIVAGFMYSSVLTNNANSKENALALVYEPTNQQIIERCSGQYAVAEKQNAVVYGEYSSLDETLKCCRAIGINTYCEAPQNIVFEIENNKPEWIINLN